MQPMNSLTPHDSQYFKEKINNDLNISDIFDQLSSVSIYDDITKDANYVLPGMHNSAVSIAISNVMMDKQLMVVKKHHKLLTKLRNSGEEYIGSNERVIATKIMKMPCNDKCANKISADEYTAIHNNYWKLADIYRQREFIIRHM
ncbi:Uncharacterized protein FWK35_00030299 [Aphis craccivora]|uniref:Uncharacterized protein n=1 Tax=Aphis craccivora TaxID=307492 RepID=A0A6G0VSB2_APHCR|nr:Uncharacterized protein FWK35_00030299 [Aphis craccivora]